MPKIAISGKGGVGKTTLTSLLAYIYAEQGANVLAVDADPSPCLADALGVPSGLRENLMPIASMDKLIYERTGAQPGTTGGYFKLNPQVDDIPDRFSVSHRGIRLLELGAVELGGSGCICPESAILKSLVTHLLLYRDDFLIMDMYAGVEHLGRATAAAVDAMIVVVEPGKRSLTTAGQIHKLATEVGIQHIYLVGNKIRHESDMQLLEDLKGNMPVLGYLPFTNQVIEAELKGETIWDQSPEVVKQAHLIAKKLNMELGRE